jgi:hypothetical protein
MKILTAAQVKQTLLQKGIKANLLDSAYVYPTKDWCKKFFVALRGQLFGQVGGYQVNSFDCDDYALTAMSMARLVHAQNKKVNASLAVGYFEYFSEDPSVNGHHAINIAFTESGVVFLEPQTGDILKLTNNEINSYTRIIM